MKLRATLEPSFSAVRREGVRIYFSLAREFPRAVAEWTICLLDALEAVA